MVFITSLLFYHFYLISKSLTTYSRSKLKFLRIFSYPLDKGCWKNYHFIFCVRKKQRVDYLNLLNISLNSFIDNSVNFSNLPLKNFNREQFFKMLNQSKFEEERNIKDENLPQFLKISLPEIYQTYNTNTSNKISNSQDLLNIEYKKNKMKIKMNVSDSQSVIGNNREAGKSNSNRCKSESMVPGIFY
jgi:hypothetical protein